MCYMSSCLLRITSKSVSGPRLFVCLFVYLEDDAENAEKKYYMRDFRQLSYVPVEYHEATPNKSNKQFTCSYLQVSEPVA